MILATAIRNAERQLVEAKVDSPELTAQWLVGHVLGLTRTQILAQSARVLNDDESKQIDSSIARRAAREPVARIIGEREFWSLPFRLNEATLEPRPDSETLVENAVKFLREKKAPRILDLGTGTGCLMLSVLNEVKEAKGLGIDIEERAIEQAKANAQRLGLAPRATFRTSNWFDSVVDTFDAILCNPPYIPTEKIPKLMPEVRKHDPLKALDGGKDGLAAYQIVIPKLTRFLKPGGFAIFEVGAGQANAVVALLRKAKLKDIEKFEDLGGIERCVVGFR